MTTAKEHAANLKSLEEDVARLEPKRDAAPVGAQRAELQYQLDVKLAQLKYQRAIAPADEPEPAPAAG